MTNISKWEGEGGVWEKTEEKKKEHSRIQEIGVVAAEINVLSFPAFWSSHGLLFSPCM